MKRIFLSIILVLNASLAAFPDVRFAVLLPFEEQSERGARMVEFYRGILMAVDSVRNTGVSVEVCAASTTGSISQLQQILAQPGMDTMDFIIGPADQGLCLTVSQFCSSHGIRHVMPFSLPGAGIAGKPRYYQVTAPWRQMQEYAVERLVQYYGAANYLYLSTGIADERGAGLVNTLRQELQRQQLRSLTCDLTDGGISFPGLLSAQHRNVIYTDNTSPQAMDMLFALLERNRHLAQTYNIEVLGFPEWKNLASQYLQNFYQWNTTIYTPYFRNPLNALTAQFDRKYQENFNTEMMGTFPRYGMMGFDIAYYFLHGIATLGDELESSGSLMQLQPCQHPLIFRQSSPDNGFVNAAVLLVNYSRDHNITVR